jgi:hypothetical protein
MTSCSGPRKSLVTGEPTCSADVHNNWPEDGDWETFCRVCREGYAEQLERRGDCDRDEAAA